MRDIKKKKVKRERREVWSRGGLARVSKTEGALTDNKNQSCAGT